MADRTARFSNWFQIIRNVALIIAGVTFVACNAPGTRSSEEKANAAAVERFDELLNRHTPRKEYYEDFYAADYVLSGFTSVPPFQFSAPLEQLMRMDDAAHDRRIQTLRLVAEGDVVVQEKIVKSSGRDIREVSIRVFRDGKITESRNYSIILPVNGESLHHSPQERKALDTVGGFVEAYNAQEKGWFERFHSPDITHENFLPFPGRKTVGYEELKDLTDFVMRVFPDRKMTIVNTYVDGDTVTLESLWKGTVESGHPVLEAGHRQENFLLSTYTVRDGKFVLIHDYGLQGHRP